MTDISDLWDLMTSDAIRGLDLYCEDFVFSNYKEQAEEILSNYYEIYGETLSLGALTRYATVFADTDGSMSQYQILYTDVCQKIREKL